MLDGVPVRRLRVRDAQSDQYIRDADTRAWFQAVAKAGESPSELMAKTGLDFTIGLYAKAPLVKTKVNQ